MAPACQFVAGHSDLLKANARCGEGDVDRFLNGVEALDGHKRKHDGADARQQKGFHSSVLQSEASFIISKFHHSDKAKYRSVAPVRERASRTSTQRQPRPGFADRDGNRDDISR